MESLRRCLRFVEVVFRIWCGVVQSCNGLLLGDHRTQAIVLLGTLYNPRFSSRAIDIADSAIYLEYTECRENDRHSHTFTCLIDPWLQLLHRITGITPDWVQNTW